MYIFDQQQWKLLLPAPSFPGSPASPLSPGGPWNSDKSKTLSMPYTPLCCYLININVTMTQFLTRKQDKFRTCKSTGPVGPVGPAEPWTPSRPSRPATPSRPAGPGGPCGQPAGYSQVHGLLFVNAFCDRRDNLILNILIKLNMNINSHHRCSIFASYRVLICKCGRIVQIATLLFFWLCWYVLLCFWFVSGMQLILIEVWSLPIVNNTVALLAPRKSLASLWSLRMQIIFFDQSVHQREAT